MKIPLRWLRDYVHITLPPGDLADRLTIAGLEVAAVYLYGLPVPQGLRVKAENAGPVWDSDKIVIGTIMGVDKHPNADRLTLATVDYGASEPKTVVTGATNIKVGDKGQKVIVALSGSVLFDGHAETKVRKELKPSKIRGVPSDAMVCSAYELGISEEHEGIILLEDDAPVGMPLVDFMGEIVLEVDVLPNMARCLSMIGVAREVAALTGQSICLPSTKVIADGEAIEGKVHVAIEDAALCRRYAAALFKNANLGPAPGWMRRRLTYGGMRPINNIVDITNYVMLEWGQPLHAFDYDLLVQRAGGAAPTITVRPARAGETLKTLDGNLRQLQPENLVIADDAGPVAIAGVMGGSATEVSTTTKNILLESANFDFLSIRRTMKGLNLPSEASVRFSRGIHPETVQPAVTRASELMRQHAGVTVCQGLIDNYPAPVPPQVIDLDMDEVHRLLGMKVPVEEAARTLRALEFQVEQKSARHLRVTAPNHRLDLQVGAADLIEEIARIHGYDRLPATLLADQLPRQHPNRSLDLVEKVRDILVTMGLQEVITYSLTEPSREAPLMIGTPDYIRIQNPISSERTVMRHSVLASVLEVATMNLRHRGHTRLFEMGFVYFPRPGEKLPAEPRRLALVMSGAKQSDFWAEPAKADNPSLDFFDLKGVIDCLMVDLHVADIAYRPANLPYFHPGQAAELMARDNSVGAFGQLHPTTAAAYGLGQCPVLAGELDVEAILAAIPGRFAFSPVPRFPAALRDVAVIVDAAIASDRVEREIRAAAGGLLRGIRLFDVYTGDSIPSGTKSLAYALSYQAEDRTLTDKEVDKAHKKIGDRLRHILKAQIRGDEANKT